MEEKYDCPKMTPKQWVANFWYYNKWFFLLGVVVVVFLAICTVQFFTKEDADASVLIVTSKEVSDQTCRELIESAESFVSDLNGDGEIAVHAVSIALHSNPDLLEAGKRAQARRAQAREDYQRYSEEILSGDSCILLIDEYYYLELSENGNLVNLYGVFEELPEAAFDYYGIRLGDTPLFKLCGFSSLDPNLVLCLKHAPIVAEYTDEERAEINMRNEEAFRQFYCAEKV